MHDRVRHRRRGLGRQHSRVVEAAAPHWSQRARSGEVARRSGAEKGRGTPPERGPWAVAGAGLAETAAVSTPHAGSDLADLFQKPTCRLLPSFGHRRQKWNPCSARPWIYRVTRARTHAPTTRAARVTPSVLAAMVRPSPQNHTKHATPLIPTSAGLVFFAAPPNSRAPYVHERGSALRSPRHRLAHGWHVVTRSALAGRR